MIASARRLATIAAAVLLVAPIGSDGQGEQGRFTGRVTDGSGAAVPGVTVTLKAAGLATEVSVVTDGVGQYLSPALSPDTYSVIFELSGFEAHTIPSVALRAGEVSVLDRQLGLAPLEERVDVVAPAPPPPPPPPPPPQPNPVAKEVLASVCGPTRPTGANLGLGRIVGSRTEPNRQLLGDGDVLMLDFGTDAGAALGQNLVVRRQFRVGDKGLPLKEASFGEGAAGLIQVVEVSPNSSVAVVVYACGEFLVGDSVEPFDALPMWTAQEGGTPQFDDPATVIFGDQGKTMGAPRDLMVIDRGALHGAARGQRLTVFRRATSERGPVVTIADAIIVAVRAESATIRIERASDAVMAGDLVAWHR